MARRVAQVAERAAYVVAAADDPLPTTASDDDVLRWWPRHAARLPAFASAAKGVLLLTPTSAAVERAFSLLRMLSDRQESALEDNVEARVMLRYNKSQRR